MRKALAILKSAESKKHTNARMQWTRSEQVVQGIRRTVCSAGLGWSTWAEGALCLAGALADVARSDSTLLGLGCVSLPRFSARGVAPSDYIYGSR